MKRFLRELGGFRPSRLDNSAVSPAPTFLYADEKILRKGGPGITRSDLLVIDKIDLRPWSAPRWK